VLPGISALLQKIPVGKWGINTGGNEYMARKRLEQCSIDAPDVFVCGDMVRMRKEDSERDAHPFLKYRSPMVSLTLKVT
jgi:hypothetical protein